MWLKVDLKRVVINVVMVIIFFLPFIAAVTLFTLGFDVYSYILVALIPAWWIIVYHYAELSKTCKSNNTELHLRAACLTFILLIPSMFGVASILIVFDTLGIILTIIVAWVGLFFGPLMVYGDVENEIDTNYCGIDWII